MGQVEQRCSPSPTAQYFYSIKKKHLFSTKAQIAYILYIHTYNVRICKVIVCPNEIHLHNNTLQTFMCTLLLLTSTRKVAMEAAIA